MYISEDNNDARYQIKAYDESSITVNDQSFSQPFYLTSTQCELFDKRFCELTESDLQWLTNQPLDLLIIGSGQLSEPLPHTLINYLETHNIGVECMTTPAACRSYMTLQAEGRRVAGLFFPC